MPATSTMLKNYTNYKKKKKRKVVEKHSEYEKLLKKKLENKEENVLWQDGDLRSSECVCV